MCGWSPNDRCLLCLNAIVESESAVKSDRAKSARDTVVATQEQIDRAPKGILIYRNLGCKRTEILRCKLAPHSDVRTAKDIDVGEHLAWEKGLVARPSLPLKRKSNIETFNWHKKTEGGVVVGDV